jgi:hypothetical protein
MIEIPKTMRDIAVAHARNGFRVFKLMVNGKKPLSPGWPTTASNDPKVVHAMWTDPFGESEDFNIGIATGGEFFVADVDVKDERPGIDTLDKLIDSGLDTNTRLARSPTGSLHYYYAYPDDRRVVTRAHTLGPSIDTRGEGGYAVAPGSIINGEAYDWVDECEISVAPPWLIEMCERTERSDALSVDTLGDTDTEANILRAIRYLETDAPEATEGAGGQTQTYTLACKIMDFGISEPETFQLMLTHWNETKAVPPWAPEELQHIVGNAVRYRQEPVGRSTAAADFTAVDIANGPSPADKDWRDPADLWAEESEPPSLPPGMLPHIVEEFAVDRGLRLGVEPGAVAVSFLTSLGSLVSAGNELQMRQLDPQWTVKPVMWAMLIGDPGTNKSGTLSLSMSPLRSVEKDWRTDFQKRKRTHEGLVAFSKQQKKPEATASDVFDDSAPPPTAPRCRRVETNDATTESMAALLAENHGGMLYFAEELAGFLASMDAYRARGGKDKPFYLQAKDGGAITVDRKTSDSLFVPNLAVSVLGSIQRDKLRSLAKGLTDDGFLQRFIPVFVKRTDDGADLPPNLQLDRTAIDVARELGAMSGTARFRFAPDADAELQSLLKFKNTETHRSAASPALRHWIDKAPNEFGRLALIFHFIEWFSFMDGLPPAAISKSTATKARRFLTEFVYGHAQALYGSLGYGDDEHAQWIAGFILSRARSDIEERDIYRSYPALKQKEKRGDIPVIMRTLEMNDWVSPCAFRTNGAAKRWRVNPLVNDGRFRHIAEAERARREDVRGKIAAEAASQTSLST